VTAPEVSVVVVTWNGRQHLDACLAAVAAQQGVRLETILVDNASTDGTVGYVRERHPEVRIVALPENRGFAGGNNAGAAEARAPLVAFLNNDTAADPGWLQALAAGLDETRGFALATSHIVYMHDPQIIDSAGDGFLRSGGAFKRLHGVALLTPLRPRKYSGVCGACVPDAEDGFRRDRRL
jgi:GT2 family glycosyltransferase